MADIKVIRHSAVHDKIFCEVSIAEELKDYFKFRPPGFQFSAKYKSKLWNGWIYVFVPLTGLLYCGLRQHLEDFTRKKNYTLEFDFDTSDTEFSVVEAQEFIKSLNIPSDIIPSVYDFQEHGFIKSVRNPRRLILCPTGSGKSLIMYLLARFYKKKTLIIEPASVQQLYKDFLSYGCPKDLLHVIKGGTEKDTEAPIVISTWNSIFEQPSRWFEQFQVVIGNECHRYNAKSLTTITTKCIKADYRFGLTGTIDDTKTDKLVLEGLFGPVMRLAKTSELIEREVLSDLKIKSIVLIHPEQVKENFAGTEYSDEIKYLIGGQERNNFIKNLALSLKGNTLVLYRFVEQHGDILYKLLKEKSPERKIFYIHGGVDGDNREAIRGFVEASREDTTFLASYGVFSEGGNIKQIDNIIFASPYRSAVKVLQSIGRGLRRSRTKTTCTVYDIADDIAFGKSYKNHALKQFETRLKIYKKENFHNEIYKVMLKIGERNV